MIDEEDAQEQGAETSEDLETPDLLRSLARDVDNDIDEALQDELEHLLSGSASTTEIQHLLASFVSESSTGPLPPPFFLERYENTYPGAAAIIFGNYQRRIERADLEQQHRHEMDRLALNANIKLGTRGQWLAAVIAILFLLAGVGILVLGMILDKGSVAVIGGVAILADVAGVAWVVRRGFGDAANTVPPQARSNNGED